MPRQVPRRMEASRESVALRSWTSGFFKPSRPPQAGFHRRPLSQAGLSCNPTGVCVCVCVCVCVWKNGR